MVQACSNNGLTCVVKMKRTQPTMLQCTMRSPLPDQWLCGDAVVWCYEFVLPVCLLAPTARSPVTAVRLHTCSLQHVRDSTFNVVLLPLLSCNLQDKI
jgi:hypothetical protein